MKKISLCLFIVCLFPPAIIAASFPQTVAFEFQEHGKFTGVIGKAYVTETAIEIVTFAEDKGEITPFAFIDTILEKHSKTEGLYNVKCQNQLGVISTGTIDIRDQLYPRITLISGKGITITNISEAGKQMKAKFMPKINIGK